MLSPIQKLDEVLEFLATYYPSYAKITDGHIFSSLIKKHPDLNEKGDFGSELIAILRKLEEDKYVVSKTVDTKKENIRSQFDFLDLYGITFKGMYFIKENHGYAEQHRKDNAENTRLVNLENHQKFHRSALTWLTAFLCVASSLAAIYYCVELYWHHGWFFHYHHD